MIHDLTLQVDELQFENARKKGEQVQILLNTLDLDNLTFLAALCKQHGAGVNKKIRDKQKIIKQYL
jgi:hypothetical protein